MMHINRFISSYIRRNGGYFFDDFYDVPSMAFTGKSTDHMHIEPEFEEYTDKYGDTYQCYVLVSVENHRMYRTFFEDRMLMEVGQEWEKVKLGVL